MRIKFITVVLVLLASALCLSPAMAAEALNPVGEAASGLLSGVIFPVLSAFLLGLVTIILNKIRIKTGIQIAAGIQEQIERAAAAGIAFAEEKAAAAVKAKLTRLTGKEKLDLAIAHVITALPHVTPEQANAIVHATLGKAIGPGATGGAGVTVQ